MLEDLRAAVCEANLDLNLKGLVTLTWGNVSGIDREKGLVVIKPSGVSYDDMTPDKLVVVDLDGETVEGDLRPSSDTPTHVVLYKAFPDIGGVTHTHSSHATSFAQACRCIPCLGTTHADHFYGDVPLTRIMTEDEVKGGYEVNTGHVIVERFADLKPLEYPGVLVANHGPFTWGKDAADSVKNAVALEQIAKMALATFSLSPEQPAIAQYLLDKHYLRKHGSGAYYGQK
jgi:L-ribulose-5-phosphate 4-epimerase